MQLTRLRTILSQRKELFRMLVIALGVVVSALMAAPQAATVYSAAKRKLPIYCVETDKKLVAISFDAAWGADDTERLLGILKEKEVLATFFLCGYWVEKYPEEVKAIAAAGHDIGNHGDTHAHGAQLDFAQNQKEIQGVHDKIKKLLGIDMNLYRPPFGEYNNVVLEAAESLHYYAIQWNIDSLDWKNYGVEHEINQVVNHKNLSNGSIVLFHNDADFTPDALPQIIDGLRAKGYSFVPISDLIIKENYTLDHEGRQKPGR